MYTLGKLVLRPISNKILKLKKITSANGIEDYISK